MSEANNVWRVEVDGRAHEIELNHTMTYRRTLTVDGTVVVDGRNWRFKQDKIDFEVGGRPAEVVLHAKYGGFAWGSKLKVDGEYVEPLRT